MVPNGATTVGTKYEGFAKQRGKYTNVNVISGGGNGRMVRSFIMGGVNLCNWYFGFDSILVSIVFWFSMQMGVIFIQTFNLRLK